MKAAVPILLLLLAPGQDGAGWNALEEALRPPTANGARLEHWPEFRPLADLSGTGALTALEGAVGRPESLGLSTPLDRAEFQRSLWAFFDGHVRSWTGVDPEDLQNTFFPMRGKAPKQEKPERALDLAARVLRLAAIRAEEAAALPDSYALSTAAKEHPVAFDESAPDRAFLPPDLLDPDGPWILLGSPTPIPLSSRHHLYFGGRSAFIVLLRLPGGRAEGLAWIKSYEDFLKKDPQNTDPPELPRFSQAALVEQALALTDGGATASTPLVTSVQLRVYRNAKRRFDMGQRDAQAVYLFRLDWDRLKSRTGAPLRAVTMDEQVYNFTLVNTARRSPWNHRSPSLSTCVVCHNFSGAQSILSLDLLRVDSVKELNPRGLALSTLEAERERSRRWKESQETFAELKSRWK